MTTVIYTEAGLVNLLSSLTLGLNRFPFAIDKYKADVRLLFWAGASAMARGPHGCLRHRYLPQKSPRRRQEEKAHAARFSATSRTELLRITRTKSHVGGRGRQSSVRRRRAH